MSDVGEPGPLAAKVTAYLDAFTRLVAASKRPGFAADAWDELATHIDVDAFERVTANSPARKWPEDQALRREWAKQAEFSSTVRRIAEVGDLVYLDTVEHVSTKDGAFSMNTLAVFEFNEHGKIRKNLTYHQRDRASAS